MFITAEFRLPTFDVDSFDRSLRSFLERVARLALRAYLDAALGRIPVRTGFLKGSFRKLAFIAGAKEIQNIAPLVRNEIYKHGGLRIKKTPSSGVNFVTPPGDVIHISRGRLSVTIENQIIYYAVNDPDWGSVDAGHIAFLNKIEQLVNSREEIAKLFSDASVTSVVKLSRSGVTKFQRKSGIGSFF